MKFKLESYGNLSEIQLKFNRNLNEISMKIQGNPVEIQYSIKSEFPLKFQWNTVGNFNIYQWNQLEVQLIFEWNTNGNPFEIPVKISIKYK